MGRHKIFTEPVLWYQKEEYVQLKPLPLRNEFGPMAVASDANDSVATLPGGIDKYSLVLRMT